MVAKTDRDVSAMAASLPRSGIRAAASLAAGKEGLIHLEFGEPSVMAPLAVRQAAAEALLKQRMVYTPTEGPPALRQALSDKLWRVNGVEASPDEVFVTHGGIGALYLALATLLETGDEVLLPDPGWPNVVSQVLALGGVPRFYPLASEDGYLPDPDSWSIGPRTRAVVVNSPSNPTGSVFSGALMERVAAVASHHGLFVISDEVYDQIAYDARPVAMRPLYPERTLAVYSFSKTYAMTGWRLGYLVTPKNRVDATKRVAEAVYSSTSMVAQEAAKAALTVPEAEIQSVVATYHRRRDLALDRLREWGLYRYTPGGAFYLMVDVSAAGDTAAVHRRLIEEHGVVTVPGSAFGASAAGELRLSLAAKDEDIGRALDAVAEVLGLR